MTGPGAAKGLLVLSHGLESSPQARKVQALRPLAVEQGWRTETPDYRGQSPEQRVAQLLELVSADKGPVVLVGSSMGAVVSVLAAQRVQVAGLFLMAPPVYHPGYQHLDHSVQSPVLHIVHGWHDDVVEAENVIRFAREHAATLHLVDDDHALCGDVPLLERFFVDFLSEVNRSLRSVAAPRSPSDAP